MAQSDRIVGGKVVVITGASAGVGRAVARLFAAAGASLALIGRDGEALDETREELEAMGGRAAVHPVDVTDAEAVFAAARTVEATLGPIDIWINNAMVTVFSPLAEMTPEEFRRVTEVCYLGQVHGTMAALSHMRPRGRGVIVQVGSSLAYRAIPLQSAYCGAKHAIRGFTDALRSELIHEGSAIRVTMVVLPAVNTPQFDWARTRMSREPRPVPPIFTPEAAARGVYEAARGEGREYWLGFSTVKMIFAAMLIPSYLDRYLAWNAYDQQQSDTPVSPDRTDNLIEPVHEPHRARGSFSHEASDALPAWPESGVRAAVLGLGLGAVALAANLIASGRSRRRALHGSRESQRNP